MNKLNISIAFLCFLSGNFAQAQIYYFTGMDQSHPHKWNDADNWDGGNVPSGGDTVVIDGDLIAGTIDSVAITTIDPELYSLELRNGAVLLNQKQLTISNSDTSTIRINNSILHNQGSIYIEDAGSDSNDWSIYIEHLSSLNNSGLIHIEVPNGYGISNSASTIINNGIIYVDVEHTSLILNPMASLENHDSIFVASQSFSCLRLEDLASLTNLSGAKIDIWANSPSTDVIYMNNSTVSNLGSISALVQNGFVINNNDPTALRIKNSILDNEGSIYIEDAGENSNHWTIYLESYSTLKNSGLVHVEDPDGYGIQNNSSTIGNSGIIYVDVKFIAIHLAGSTASLENHDSIFIASQFVSCLKVTNAASLTNFTNAKIDISTNSTVTDAIYIQNSSIINFGSISAIAGDRFVIVRSGGFFAHQGGLLTVEDITSGQNRILIEANGIMDISYGAHIKISQVYVHDFIEVQTGGILNCAGTIEFD